MYYSTVQRHSSTRVLEYWYSITVSSHHLKRIKLKSEDLRYQLFDSYFHGHHYDIVRRGILRCVAGGRERGWHARYGWGARGTVVLVLGCNAPAGASIDK